MCDGGHPAVCPDRMRLDAIREWATTALMRRPWPPGDGTAAVLDVRRELLGLFDEQNPAVGVLAAIAYIRTRYGTADLDGLHPQVLEGA